MPANVVISGTTAGSVTILKQNWTQVSSYVRIWTATGQLTGCSATETITATIDSGDSSTTSLVRLNDPPSVLSFSFDNYSNGTIYPDKQAQTS